MLNNLGKKTSFIGKVGNDQFGILLRDTLNNIGIEIKNLIMDNEFNTTLAFVHTKSFISVLMIIMFCIFYKKIFEILKYVRRRYVRFFNRAYIFFSATKSVGTVICIKILECRSF